jgi:hypothetical protein
VHAQKKLFRKENSSIPDKTEQEEEDKSKMKENAFLKQEENPESNTKTLSKLKL